MDPKMDPKMDPVMHIDLYTTEKLKSTTWFEVKLTFGSREIALLILDGPNGPPRFEG